jgi:hypothetical protein
VAAVVQALSGAGADAAAAGAPDAVVFAAPGDGAAGPVDGAAPAPGPSEGRDTSAGAAVRLPKLGIALQLLGVDYGGHRLGLAQGRQGLGRFSWEAQGATRLCDPELGIIATWGQSGPEFEQVHKQLQGLMPCAAVPSCRSAEFRRQGIAGSLMDLLGNVAAEAGCGERGLGSTWVGLPVIWRFRFERTFSAPVSMRGHS